jgi:hypothetical protein
MNTRGICFLNVRQFVVTKYDLGKWEQVLALLTDADRGLVRKAAGVGWYDIRAFGRLLRAVDQACGRGDYSMLKEIGAYEAEADFGRTLRVFLHVLSVDSVLQMRSRLWRHFFSSGKWQLIPLKGGTDGILSEWIVDEVQCLELCGYLERLLEFADGQCVSVTHAECRGRGDQRCVFQLRWQ